MNAAFLFLEFSNVVNNVKTKCSHEKSRAYMLTVNHLQTHIQQSNEIEQVLGFAQYKRTSMPMHFRHCLLYTSPSPRD